MIQERRTVQCLLKQNKTRLDKNNKIVQKVNYNLNNFIKFWIMCYAMQWRKNNKKEIEIKLLKKLIKI